MAELAKLPGLDWMRILYAYPSYFTEELIDEIANNPKVIIMTLSMTLKTPQENSRRPRAH